MSKFYRIEHFACPKCKNRKFVLKSSTPYTGRLPIKGDEDTSKTVIEATCIICYATLPLSTLIVSGVYDPAEEMEKVLNES